MPIRTVKLPESIYDKLIALQREDEELQTTLDRLIAEKSPVIAGLLENKRDFEPGYMYQDNKTDELLFKDKERKTKRYWKI